MRKQATIVTAVLLVMSMAALPIGCEGGCEMPGDSSPESPGDFTPQEQDFQQQDQPAQPSPESPQEQGVQGQQEPLPPQEQEQPDDEGTEPLP